MPSDLSRGNNEDTHSDQMTFWDALKLELRLISQTELTMRCETVAQAANVRYGSWGPRIWILESGTRT